MKSIRIGVVGVGALGQHHARILAGFDHVDLTAVVDQRPEQGKEIATKYGCEWYSDAGAIHDLVDAAVIAAPTCHHSKIGHDFLEQRLPLLIEKPLASNLAEASSLVQLAEETETLLQVGHIERFNPAFQTARSLIREPRYIRSERVSPFTFRSTDIGVVHDLMIHDIDLAIDLVDSPIISVSAMGLAVMGTHEDIAQARLQFANGCIVDLTASRLSPNAARTQLVWSDSGCTQVDFTSRKISHFAPTDRLKYGESPVEIARRPGTDPAELKNQVFGRWIEELQPVVPNDDALTAELNSFIKAIRSEGPVMVDGRAGLRAMEAADRILEEIASHEWDGAESERVGPILEPVTRLRRAG